MARAFVPPGALGKLEDFLHSGGVLTLAPISEVTSEDLARGVQSVAQLESDELTTRLFQHNQLHLTYGADTYLTRLRGLARKAKSSLEESGSTSLFIGIGTLKWELEGKPMESPLILAPVRLTGGTGRNKVFELSLDDSGTSTPNFCLLEKLDEAFELKIPGLREPQEDGFGLDVDKALQSVREALLQRQLPFSVEESLVLGNFQFSTFRIWKDVDDHWSRFLEAPVVKHLVETYNDDFPRPDSSTYPDIDLPLPADESQYEAVQAAIAGETFVLEGPPGTGKSQTITNIIAGALASGKRVLFVAEKPAALEVVKRRLDQVGVGAFSLDLHGRTRKRAEVAAAIREALEMHTAVDRVEVDTIRTELLSTSRELDRYAQAIHTLDDVGYTLWSARQRLLAAGEGPSLAIKLQGTALTKEQLASIRLALETFPDTARLAASSEGQPWLLAGSEARFTDVAPALERFWQLIRSLPTSHPVLGPAVLAATSVEDFETLLRLIEKDLPPVQVLDQIRTPGWEHLFGTWRQTVAAWSRPPFLAGYRPEVIFAPVDQWLAHARSAAAAGMFVRKGRLREAAKPVTEYSLNGSTVEPDQLVGLLEQLSTLRAQVDDLRRQVAAAVPGMDLDETWHPYAPAGVNEMDRRRDDLTAIGRLLTDDSEAGRALRAIPGNVVTIDQVTAANMNMVADGWRRVLDVLAADEGSVRRWQDGRTLVAAWSESDAGWRDDVADGLRRLQRLGNLHSALKSLGDAGLDEAVTQLVTGEIAAGDALSAFERGLAQASLSRAWRAAALDGFDAEAHDVRVHRFSTADARWRDVQSSVIPELAASQRPFAPGAVTGQVGELLREVNKVRGGKPLRYLLEQYHETVATIMPCFLMSPESVAQFLRPGLFTFDLVVIDEASQVRVAEAVGALGRAKSAVIVGDSKQMPPTSFGGSRYVEEDWDPYAAEAEVPVDQESILTEAIQSRIPRRWLSWHYRSQAESLIAFSNANYYEGRLASFPTPNDVDPRMGLHFVPVPGGRFLRSGKGAQLRTNPVEAAKVVADIRRRLHDPVESQNSIGVVTFNAQQQALIDSMLQDSEDDLVLEAYNREGDSKLFVKNLENVQGDERDVILFSIAYSKDDDDPNSNLPLQWGPLNAEGGERRLNVAVTRARKQVVIFCSFKPEDIDLNRTGSTALAHLRNYLLIARDGVESNAALLARKPGETDRHRAEIAAALRASGLHVEEDKGLSDFRVDLVVAPANNPKRPALVILLDGPRWSRGKRTQDRDVVPVDVLGKLMGWPDVMRIWLPDWTREPASVVARVQSRTLAAHAELVARAAPFDVDAPAAEVPSGEAPKDEPSWLASTDEEVTPPSPNEDLPRPETVPVADPLEVMTPNRPTPTGAFVSSEDHEAAQPTEPSPLPPATSVPSPAGTHSAATGTPVISEFVAAHTNVVGSKGVLDALPDRAAAETVREQLLDIIEAEGPIELTRLARIVARRFGLNAVRAARADDIIRLVPKAQLRKSRKFGNFAWPTELDPEIWAGFRIVGENAPRTLDEISPEEVVNAMQAVHAEFPDFEYVEQLLRPTAELFGIVRLGVNVRSRLEAVATMLPADDQS